MKPILNVSNPLELNALFIQSTRWCNLNCKNCYVKEHDGGENGYHTSWKEQLELFKAYWYGNHGCHANQITISIDDLPKSYGQRYWHMKSLFLGILDYTKEKSSINPEVHMTFNSPETASEYGFKAVELLKSGLSMISFSNIRSEDMFNIGILNKVIPVNFNHLIPNNITSLNIDKYIEKICFVSKIVSTIYLIINKEPVGKARDNIVKINSKSRMESDMMVINTLMKRLPSDVKRKIQVDGCLQDTIKFRRTGFGCSSNVSRVQVWPDGSVSGCPYAFSGNTPIGRTSKDIMDNIATVRKQYDFKERCHLPDVYNSIVR